MALTVSDILARNLLPGMHLVSGGLGLENVVTWVNIMEILDTPESTQPGELLITTGYGLADRSRYSGLIARLKERGVSAVAIQTGYYIDRSPNWKSPPTTGFRSWISRGTIPFRTSFTS